MTRMKRLLRICTYAFLSAATVLLLATQAGFAQGIVYGDRVQADEVIDADILLTGTDIVVDGTVNGDVLAIGNTITVNGTINGSLVAAGQRIAIQGQVENSVYAVSTGLQMGENGATGRNLFFLGFELQTQPGSAIGRDLYAFSLGATLSGELNRNASVIIGPVEILNFLLDVFNVPVEENLLSGQQPAPTAVYSQPLSLAMAVPGDGHFPVQWMESLGVVSPAPPVQGTSPTPTSDPTVNFLLNLLRDYITLLGVGGLTLWVFPRLFGRWVAQIRATPLPSAAWGMVVFVTGLALFFLLASLILALGFFLGFLTLNRLAVAVYGLGYTTLGMAAAVFVLVVSYLSKAVFAFFGAKLILERTAPQLAQSRFVPLLLGLLVYVLLRSIPFLGWVIGVAATLLGLGAIWMVFRDRRPGGLIEAPAG